MKTSWRHPNLKGIFARGFALFKEVFGLTTPLCLANKTDILDMGKQSWNFREAPGGPPF